MIANAMDGDSKLTAPQISRKLIRGLEQLGLYIPRNKRSGANILTRDEDVNGSNNANDSDDETLISLMNRGKKDTIRFSESPEQTTGREVLENESDDEMLSSVLKKPRRSLSKSNDQNLIAISIQEAARGNSLEHRVEEAAISSGRELDKQSTAENDDVDVFSHASPNATGQAEVTTSSSGGSLSKNFKHQKMNTDLEDSGDEATHSALSHSGSKRKFRMTVLDDEDDD